MVKDIRKYMLDSLRLSTIRKMVFYQYPNDAELGKHIRKYISDMENLKKK